MGLEAWGIARGSWGLGRGSWGARFETCDGDCGFQGAVRVGCVPDAPLTVHRRPAFRPRLCRPADDHHRDEPNRDSAPGFGDRCWTARPSAAGDSAGFTDARGLPPPLHSPAARGELDPSFSYVRAKARNGRAGRIRAICRGPVLNLFAIERGISKYFQIH